jgi:multidrug efflux system membrane fusion protein
VPDDFHDFDGVGTMLTRPRTTKLLTIIAVLAVAAGGAAALTRTSAFRSTAAPQAPAAPPPVGVVAASVRSHDVPIYLRGVGTVIAYNNVLVRSQITGELVKISFQQGQQVKKGDVLAVIDPRPYQAQLDQAIANRDRDQAHLKNAEIDYNRYTDLAKQKSIAQQLADSQKAIVDQLVAIIKSDEAIIESARVNLGYTNLTSPIDGVTGIRQIDIGNIIHPTDVNGLVDVTQIEPISLIFTLPEAEFVPVQEARLVLDTRHDGLTVPASVVQQGPVNGAEMFTGLALAVRFVRRLPQRRVPAGSLHVRRAAACTVHRRPPARWLGGRSR